MDPGKVSLKRKCKAQRGLTGCELCATRPWLYSYIHSWLGRENCGRTAQGDVLASVVINNGRADAAKEFLMNDPRKGQRVRITGCDSVVSYE